MTKSAAEKTEQAFETFAGPANETFKKSYERSVEMMSEMGELTKKNLEAFAESARIATKGFEELGTRASAYSRDAMEKSAEATRGVTGAKSVQEAMELQSDFAKTAFETYVEEMNALTGMFTSTVRDASEPLNAQAGSVMNLMQKTA